MRLANGMDFNGLKLIDAKLFKSYTFHPCSSHLFDTPQYVIGSVTVIAKFVQSYDHRTIMSVGPICAL